MDHTTQCELIRRVLRMQDEGTTQMSQEPCRNPVSAYTSPARLQRERERLFRDLPLLAAFSSDLPEAGSYQAHEEGELPFLLVRTRDGGLAAYANVCRHRGARVASGAGRCAGRFTCPYHGWTYDDAGKLVSQPCSEGFAGLSEGATSLVRVAAAERHGLIFVRARPQAAGEPEIDVDAALGGAQRELAPLGLEGYRCFAQRRVRTAMNWKLVIDTFLEAYHVPALHARSLSPGILGSPALWDAFGNGGRLLAVRRSVAAMRTAPEKDWDLLAHSVILYNLFPNTMLIHQIDHVEVVQAFPAAEGPDFAEVVFRLYTPQPVETESARRHFQSNFDLLVGTVENEDFVTGQGVQRGFHAGVQDSIVFGRNEPALSHYHRSIAAIVGCDAPQGA